MVSRRRTLAGATAVIAGAAGSVYALFDSGDEESSNDTDGTEQNTSDETAPQHKRNESEADAGVNTSEETNTSQNDTQNESAEEQANESKPETNEAEELTEEESTQPEMTGADDAVATANVTDHHGPTEWSVTGEIWNVGGGTLDEVVIKVRPLDASGTPLTDAPLVDGTFGLEPDGVHLWEVRTRDPTVVENVDDYEVTVEAFRESH